MIGVFSTYTSTKGDKYERHACLCDLGQICNSCKQPYCGSSYCFGGGYTIRCPRFEELAQRCLCYSRTEHLSNYYLSKELVKCMGQNNKCPYAQIYGSDKTRRSNHCLTCMNKYRKITGRGPVPYYASLVRYRKSFPMKIEGQDRVHQKLYESYKQHTTELLTLFICLFRYSTSHRSIIGCLSTNKEKYIITTTLMGPVKLNFEF